MHSTVLPWSFIRVFPIPPAVFRVLGTGNFCCRTLPRNNDNFALSLLIPRLIWYTVVDKLQESGALCMAMPVSFSKTPQVMDAIGALKVTNYVGHSRLDNVYCYLRAYVHAGSLVVSISSFERTPLPESRTGAAFRFSAGGDYLFFSCSAAGDLSANLYARAEGKDQKKAAVFLGTPELFAGSDEQGEHWGFALTIPADLIEKQFGASLAPGSVFFGNVYKFCQGEDAFGAAFGADEAAYLPDEKSFGEFVVVPY